ncbi:MAG TPA: hypothetical protein PKM73_08385 [Verrucomicrobiota bacterium]|nr:hypothetical protein [Verrucomicrobiota bacterium]HNU49565.1 hypothetical protein [Verrucomicrobiota bacterium]
MKRRSSRIRQGILLAVAAALLVSAYHSERGLNQRRSELGLTRVEPLTNAPPILALTTVALGGFRGLIANALWIRAMDLQENDQYFEKVQLADWITKLQPHNATVWVVQAWDMSYNISIKFSDFRDRWMWVKRGIELLRDQALRYNPHEVLIYRELAWHFQHKMGANMDDAHKFYKGVWAAEMEAVLPGGHPDWKELLDPQTPEQKERVARLREIYRLDPASMQETDTTYGPLDWRMPETHAIYWAALGKRLAKSKEDLIQLRRVVYQAMDLAFRRGRLIESHLDEGFRLEPNLDIIPKTHAAYEEAMAEDAVMRDHISRAHKNFLLNAVYFLYTHARTREAERWLAVVKEKYPRDYPAAMTLDDYVVKRVSEDAGETDMDRTTSNIMGALRYAYLNLVDGDEDAYNGYQALARNLWTRYQSKILGGPSEKRVGLPPLRDMQIEVVRYLLTSSRRLRPEAEAILRSQLPPELLPGTNIPPTQPTPPG